MASGEIPVKRVAENQSAFAIRDINPRAPVHVLIIPKAHIDDARTIEFGHSELLTALFLLATEVGRTEGVHHTGYRLAFNVGAAAGMTISHLHLHLLGGRALGPEG
jgi:histidine triad (HIT) family protein